MLPPFDLIEPPTLNEALQALAEEPSVPLAGGTNLLVDLRARRASPERLVSLGNLTELRGIGRMNGQISVGGLTTLADIMTDPVLEDGAPALVASARIFGGAMVRNAATIAGNLCYGSPAADLVPPLMALGAEVVLQSWNGERIVPLDGFCLGVRETACRRDELLTQIRWPAPPPQSAQCFYKLGLRKGDAIAVTSLSVLLGVEDGRCTLARIALGAVAPVIMRAKQAESMLVAQPLDEARIDAAARQAATECAPIDDLRASAAYRRHAVHVLTRRLVNRAWEQISEAEA